jgi:chromosome segregation ATPase
MLVAAVVALALYAIDLKSDVDDANARLASQQQQLDQAQDTGAGVAAAAKSAYDDLSAQLGAAQEDAGQAVDQAAAALDQAEQAAADARGTADELQTELDAAQAKADTAASCAQSFLSAFSGVFGGATLREGIEATVAELRALQPKCAPALGQSGSGS